MKIGIYGGTFNPPHLGHLTAARAVFELLNLDQLLLVPAGMPPHKELPAGSPTPEQRLEMTRLAGEQLGLGNRVRTLDIEVYRQGKSFTADTLAQLKAQHPEDELWLLMGTDMFLTLQAWHEPEKILSLAGIAAFDFFTLVLGDFGLTPEGRVFDFTVNGWESGVTFAGYGGWTRIEADFTVNGAAHNRRDGVLSYLQYGAPNFPPAAEDCN